MRADGRVGSFKIETIGEHKGRWSDYADGTKGDMVDLIRICESCDERQAIQIAKQILMMDDTLPSRPKQKQRKAVPPTASEVERWAQARWLGGQAIAGSPADAYLAGRGIALASLPRSPGSLRFDPACQFHGRNAAGTEIKAPMPAMLAAICAPDGRIMGCHRTYLDAGGDPVRKASVDTPKKILGRLMGGCIRLWSGMGPRGGRGPRWSDIPSGSRIYLAEGIEDGLSAVVIDPTLIVFVTATLGNMAEVVLPDGVSEVVLIADNDPGNEARALLRKAELAHMRAGRDVRVWRAAHGKDLNDELRHAQGGLADVR